MNNANCKNIAVVLAGGTGRRFGGSTPKQFVRINGRYVIEYTIQAFDQCPLIDEIAIVVHPDYMQLAESLVSGNNLQKVKKILSGGKERYESSLAAINAYSDDPCCRLLLHDAARPLVSRRIIEDVVRALDTHTAVGVAVAATDTIVRVSNDGLFIEAAPDRSLLRRIQTPQGFHYNTIKQAYDTALQDPHFAATDDCGVVTRYMPDEKVYIVEGEDTNIKLTYPEDTFMMENLLKKSRDSFRA